MSSRPPQPADDELPNWPEEPKPANRRQGLTRKTSTVVPTRVPHEVAEKLQRRAQAEGKSLNQVCREALTAAAQATPT